jgi:hypothetical protein
VDERIDTRRALVGGAAAGSLLLLLGRPGAARAQLNEQDREILRELVDLEAEAALLYEGAVEDGAVAGEAGSVLRSFAEQQAEHVDALTSALGSRPPAPVAGDAGDRQAVLERAVELEDGLVAAYLDAHGRLGDAALLTLGSGIMANHGQHLVALRDLLGEDVLVPDAFATGTST